MPSGTMTKLHGFLVHLTRTLCLVPNPLNNVEVNSFGREYFFLCRLFRSKATLITGVLRCPLQTQKGRTMHVFSWLIKPTRTKCILTIPFGDLEPVYKYQTVILAPSSSFCIAEPPQKVFRTRWQSPQK